jgi:hypothetical protein
MLMTQTRCIELHFMLSGYACFRATIIINSECVKEGRIYIVSI